MQITQSQEYVIKQALYAVASATEAVIVAGEGIVTQALVEAQRTALDIAVWIVAGDACPDNLSTSAHRVSSGFTFPRPELGYWSTSAQASWDDENRRVAGRDTERYLDVRAQLVAKAQDGDVELKNHKGYTQWTDGAFTHVQVVVDLDNEWNAVSVLRPLTRDEAFEVERLIPAGS